MKKREMFMDLINFIIYYGVEFQDEMLFLKEEDYKKGIYDNMLVGNGEKEVWSCLHKMLNIKNNDQAYEELEKGFQNVEFDDNESTAIITFNNNKYAVLVA
ncbi:hypothetical protein [Inconstantimicrobium mannanitabidum]|uniref:Uncharacterized protein n=1 Tax=Inconstantimicrobium mannanitabidum TaxID=1604901 RepID=A0ACB5R9F0_9CLOT|nr:hypothetical protein [Clostridium sp. TW13]GKX65812.1 hypothetical protein rsdtw13_10700 [Clostridium sp. TW13]